MSVKTKPQLQSNQVILFLEHILKQEALTQLLHREMKRRAETQIAEQLEISGNTKKL